MAKQLIVICLLLAVVKLGSAITVDDFRAMLKTIGMECVKDFPVTHEQMIAMKKGDFPEDKNLKCFSNCMMEKMQTMKNGKFDTEFALANLGTLPEELQGPTKNGIEKCKNAADGIEDHCEAAYAMSKCFQKNNPSFFLANN